VEMAELSPLPGDCDDNGEVSVDELVGGVRIVLGIERPESCPGLDRNSDDVVTVDELVAAIAADLRGPSRAFANPEPVTIRGYEGVAMEPFVSRDGRYLFFNNSNAPSVNTNLYWAERIDDVTFEYEGEIAGVNSEALDAVPSMDSDGNFYFVSTRSYTKTLSTIYSGSFSAGAVAGVEIVQGISKKIPGDVNFDAEISADGNTLYFVDGEFVVGSIIPVAADLAIAVRGNGLFERLDESPELLANVNSDALEYAPSVSANGLELFFTRLAGSFPAICRAARRGSNAPFGVPEQIPAIEGFVEAPSLSPDGRSLYYHRLQGGSFAIYRVSR